MRLREFVAAFLLAGPAAVAQSSAVEHGACMERFAELSRQLVQTQMELAVHRLEWSQAKARNLEEQLARVAAERGAIEQEEKSNRDEVLNADMQLAQKELSEDEKVELRNLRNALLAETHAAIRKRQGAANETEAALREQLVREKAVTQELQKRFEALQAAAR